MSPNVLLGAELQPGRQVPAWTRKHNPEPEKWFEAKTRPDETARNLG